MQEINVSCPACKALLSEDKGKAVCNHCGYKVTEPDDYTKAALAAVHVIDHSTKEKPAKVKEAKEKPVKEKAAKAPAKKAAKKK